MEKNSVVEIKGFGKVLVFYFWFLVLYFEFPIQLGTPLEIMTSMIRTEKGPHRP